MDNKIKDALDILIQALKEYEGYRIGWQANIAMAFKDECYKEFSTNLYTEYGDAEENIHEIANKASNNFLNTLCK